MMIIIMILVCLLIIINLPKKKRGNGTWKDIFTYDIEEDIKL